MESVFERMEREKTKEKILDFMQKQGLSYEAKVNYAWLRAKEFVKECNKRDLNYHVSVGGLDSIVLLLFLRERGIKCPAVSCSMLEDKSIQKIHKELGVISLPPAMNATTGRRWTKAEVIKELGFPVISKEIAAKIELLANPSESNSTVRHAIITGETGEYGGWQKDSRMKLPKRWLELFGGYANEQEGTNYRIPDFNVSAKCCYYLKEKPADDWARAHNSVPFLGLMASEGGRRAKALKMHGCNYFGKTSARSCPFAIWNRQDLLQMALDLNAPVPEIYGTIERKEDGTLYTTKAQRTGCSMCGFGIHIEKRPHRFDLKYKEDPREWEYLMFHLCKDEQGNEYGWARVLDYIGVDWKPLD